MNVNSMNPQTLAREEYLVAAGLDGQARESRILLAAPRLGPHLGGLRRLDDLGRLDLADILLSSGGTGPGGPAAGAVWGPRDPPGGSGNDSGDPASALSGGPAGPSDA